MGWTHRDYAATFLDDIVTWGNRIGRGAVRPQFPKVERNQDLAPTQEGGAHPTQSSGPKRQTKHLRYLGEYYVPNQY